MTITVDAAAKAVVKGPVDTSRFRFEVLFTGATWTDLTSRVIGEPSGRAEELDSVEGTANANSASVVLDNGDGAFSRNNTASPYYGHLTPKKPARLSIVVPGYPDIPVFTGFVRNWLPSAKDRKCQVSLADTAFILAGQPIVPELIVNTTEVAGVKQYTTGRTWNWVFERAAWKAGIRWDYVETYGADYSSTSQANDTGAATAITHAAYSTSRTRATYRQGGASGTVSMIVDIIRATTTGPLMMKATWIEGNGLDVLSKLAEVVDGRIYFDAQGALRLRSRMYVGDSATPAETLTVSNFEDVIYSQNFEGGNVHAPLVNYVEVKAKPLGFWEATYGQTRYVVQEAITWEGKDLPWRDALAGSDFGVTSYPGASDPRQFLTFPDGWKLLPNEGWATVTGSSNTAGPSKDFVDYGALSFVSGFPVYEGHRMEVKVQTARTYPVAIKQIRLLARWAKIQPEVVAVHQDDPSIESLGKKGKTITNDHIPDAVHGRNLAAWWITKGKDLKDLFTLPTMHGLWWLELGDTVAFSETITNLQPTLTNGVLVAYAWKLGKAGYRVTPEVVPPAPAFTLSTTVTGIQEVGNRNQFGQGENAINFPAVAGAGRQIGLTTIPAFTELLDAVRKVTMTAWTTASVNQVVYYAGYIWAVGTSGWIGKIDPLTLTVVNSWQIHANSNFIGAAVYGRYLYAADTMNGAAPANERRVIWFDMDNPGTVQGTNWDVKVRLDTLATDPLYNPRFCVRVGTKLYVTSKSQEPIGSQTCRLVKFDIAATTLITAVEANVAVAPTNQFEITAQGIVASEAHIWALSYQNYAYNQFLAVNASAGAQSVTMTTVTGLAIGRPCKIGSNSNSTVSTDQPNLVTNITGSGPYTVTFRDKLARNFTTADVVMGFDAFLAKFDPATNTVVSITTLNEGTRAQGLAYDGSKAWVSFIDTLATYDLTTGTPTFQKALTNATVSAGMLLFDGTYLWWTRAGKVSQVDPRNVFTVGEFVNDSTRGGVSVFSGAAMFVGGDSGTVYHVPRWPSMVI